MSVKPAYIPVWATGNYPSGDPTTQPWQSTPTAVAPSFSYYTPGVAIDAPWLNYNFNERDLYLNALNDWAVSGAYNWTYRVGATNYVDAVATWNSYAQSWSIVQDIAGNNTLLLSKDGTVTLDSVGVVDSAGGLYDGAACCSNGTTVYFSAGSALVYATITGTITSDSAVGNVVQNSYGFPYLTGVIMLCTNWPGGTGPYALAGVNSTGVVSGYTALTLPSAWGSLSAVPKLFGVTGAVGGSTVAMVGHGLAAGGSGIAVSTNGIAFTDVTSSSPLAAPTNALTGLAYDASNEVFVMTYLDSSSVTHVAYSSNPSSGWTTSGTTFSVSTGCGESTCPTATRRPMMTASSGCGSARRSAG